MEHVLFLLLPLLLIAENSAVLLWTPCYGSDYSDGIYTILKTADDALLLGGFLQQEQTGTFRRVSVSIEKPWSRAGDE
jgi:hypothetical protein